MEQIAENKCFGGLQRRYTHQSRSLNCLMHFSVFLPPQAEHGKVPVLYWLSGLTCSDENFVQKAGAQQFAARYGVAIVAPDTSPRGEGVPDDPDAAYDFGLGAGFYVNATQQPWAGHYQMESYISEELPELINAHFPVDAEKSGLFGHSMGGHGALTLGLKYPQRFRSLSAFAPISSPMHCPWGEKALGNYLGDDRETWKQADSSELLQQHGQRAPKILVDQGSADAFLSEQLKPELLQAAATAGGADLTLRMQPGYDHSYFFIASFMEDHIRFHCEQLA
tara:strand:- start:41 stop:880 length:840 start_codon:yes stop_codon:yes gene_type:complete